MADKPYKPVSGFIADRKALTQEELWQLLFYCCNAANNEEKWEINIVEKYNWVEGQARGEDHGKFYHWLVSKGLDKKIEIVRG